jgi:hypothetical protein
MAFPSDIENCTECTSLSLRCDELLREYNSVLTRVASQAANASPEYYAILREQTIEAYIESQSARAAFAEHSTLHLNGKH